VNPSAIKSRAINRARHALRIGIRAAQGGVRTGTFLVSLSLLLVRVAKAPLLFG
jgi:hypothetical protein